MITTAWELGGGRLGATGSRFCKWAHMLGYGGHFLTKSRRYSVTFGQLRRARTEHRSRRTTPTASATPGAAPSTTPSSSSCRTWAYAGTGYTASPDAELALASAARARADWPSAARLRHLTKPTR